MGSISNLSSGLRMEWSGDSSRVLRIGTDEHPDWLGPGEVLLDGPLDDGDEAFDVDGATLAGSEGPRLCAGRGGVQLVQEDIDGRIGVLRLEVRAPATGRGGHGITQVRHGVHFRPEKRRAQDVPPGLRGFGHQYTEFGLPVQADAALDRWFHLPFRPACLFPLWLTTADGAVLLLAPLDSFHEQVCTFPSEPGVSDPSATGLRWGWHGDLDELPMGHSSSLAVMLGDSPRRLLDEWVALLDVRPNPPVDSDALGRSVSYWTDNGASYWYKSEPPRTVTQTITDAVASVEAAGVPIGAVQIDSWFYPHETTRPFDTDDWVVPPTGLVDWAPRADILPDGLVPLRDAVHPRPLTAHCRHLSRQSPLVRQFECWTDETYAHPVGADYYEAFLDRAEDWGVETFEHDWLVECWTGVEGLRAAPGRPRAWQEGIDRAAATRDMTLQWCMATPADLFQTASLDRVTSIRTSGDHGYLVGPGFLWAWFCYTNVLARAFGLAPFKDVFHSDGEHAEVEALLSSLSTGPVGVGDAIGATRAAVVAATCRADGVIIRPDVPIAAVDASIRSHAVSHPVPLVAECHTDHDAGRWTQVFVANTYRRSEAVSGDVDLGASTPSGRVARLDLRSGDVAVDDDCTGWNVTLESGTWQHHLLAPVASNGIVVWGEIAKCAPVGRARLGSIVDDAATLTVEVIGPEEPVTISGLRIGGDVAITVDGAVADAVTAPTGSTTAWSVAVTAPAVIHVSAV